MSWQDYVDNQLIASQCVSKACIAGHDGGVWAKSEAFEVSLLMMMQCEEKRDELSRDPEISFLSLLSADVIKSQYKTTVKMSGLLLVNKLNEFLPRESEL